jgi:hypothetical protein
MPAVNPTRLRFQIEGVMHFFTSPVEFHQRLSGLFELYANRALRFGDSNTLRPLIPMYHLPMPLIRQLEIDLERKINEEPDAALLLADELWNDSFLEVKQTAITILGHMPVDSPTPIIDRLNTWMDDDMDASLLAQLLSSGTRQLQVNYPQVWEEYLSNHLQSDDPKKLSLGIQGLIEGLKNPGFKNLPAIFRLISPFIREPEPSVVRDLVQLVEALAKRSPTETGFFLRQMLSLSESKETIRLIKQCLPFFPLEIQTDLKSMTQK